MNIIQWLYLALTIWDSIAARTKNTADEKIASEIRAALAEYEKVHGNEVTKVQLESLRTIPQW
ncbi:MAG: hypothetical protein M1451_08875 [Acidobacteria bacterium]|nr:hypothetical protein [Acidobacteriota bacterium]